MQDSKQDPSSSTTHNENSSMKKSLTRVAFGIVALSLVSVASAQVKPEDQIKYRKAGYSFMSWNMSKIKANLEGTYDAAQVTAAANAIASIAGSGMGALYEGRQGFM